MEKKRTLKDCLFGATILPGDITRWVYISFRGKGGCRYTKDFAKEFYRTKSWKMKRAYIFRRDHGLCVRCGRPGEIVHHKIYLTPDNIDDPDITLSEGNLELLCRDCHAAEHLGIAPASEGLHFDDDGNLVKDCILQS